MNRVVKAALWAVPPILVLVVLPQYLLRYVPASVNAESESALGFSIPGFVDDLAVFGVVLAVFSFLQTWAYRWSLLKPVASALHVVTSYTLLLFLLGFGNPLTFGTANIGINPSAMSGNFEGLGTLQVNLVSTILALLVGVAVVMKVAQTSLKYREDKRFHAEDLGEGSGTPQAPAPPPSPPVQGTQAVCTNCGKPVSGTDFCTNCGARVSRE